MVVGVAIKEKATGKYYSLPKPNRHGDIIKWVFNNISEKGTVKSSTWLQGFVDDYGNFLDRFEAAAHVKEIKQELRQHPSGHQSYETLDILFSEDVW